MDGVSNLVGPSKSDFIEKHTEENEWADELAKQGSNFNISFAESVDIPP